mmetsp:Transcript_26580/g.37698  ORF Transcript_26580/g.37698 Transcript_26580/m.37698 type:complete len:142 (+) Transcript_26580:64-489(+)
MRTIGALALWPTGNVQGNYYFFSLDSGRITNRTHATQLPMPNNAIDCVHAIARRQKANPGLVFLDRNKQPILDDGLQDDISAADDSTYHNTGNTSVTDDSSNNSKDSSYHTDDDSSIASETSSSNPTMTGVTQATKHHPNN